MDVYTDPAIDINTPEVYTSTPIMPVDPEDYNTSAFKFEKLADLKLRNGDTVILGGYGCLIKVRNDSLSIEYQRSHTNDKILKLNRGTHKIKTIVLFSRGGYLTFDAIEWACQQGITIYMLNYNGDLLQVLTPKQPRNAKLAYLQYKASESQLGVEIARELVRQKTVQQIAVLKMLPSHSIVAGRTIIMNGQRVTLKAKGQVLAGDFIWKQFEDGLSELSTMNNIDNIRLLEAHLAIAYWSYFVGVPIEWKASDKKTVPLHWHAITERISSISGNRNAQRAMNPYHCTLNFAYALLEAQVLQAIIIAGLEPTVGYLHTYREDRNSLVFDLMECYRSVVDHMVLSFFRKTKFKKGDFYQALNGEVRLNEELRRYVLASCRIDPTEIDRLVRWLRSTLLEQ